MLIINHCSGSDFDIFIDSVSRRITASWNKPKNPSTLIQGTRKFLPLSMFKGLGIKHTLKRPKKTDYMRLTKVR